MPEVVLLNKAILIEPWQHQGGLELTREESYIDQAAWLRDSLEKAGSTVAAIVQDESGFTCLLKLTSGADGGHEHAPHAGAEGVVQAHGNCSEQFLRDEFQVNCANRKPVANELTLNDSVAASSIGGDSDAVRRPVPRERHVGGLLPPLPFTWGNINEQDESREGCLVTYTRRAPPPEVWEDYVGATAGWAEDRSSRPAHWESRLVMDPAVTAPARPRPSRANVTPPVHVTPAARRHAPAASTAGQ